MPFVVDASVTASWLLPNEGAAGADKAFALLASDYALVPALWWFEIRNVFVTNERRGRIGAEQSGRALGLLSGLPIQVDHNVEEAHLMRLAREHRLSVYDAAYLELALRAAVSLATFDAALAAAAQAEQVALIG